MFVTQIDHRHCLAITAFILVLDMYLLRLNMYCDGSTTIMWSVNIFIKDFTLPCRRVKKQFRQVIKVRPVGLHSLKVFQLSSDVNCHPILQQI